MCVCVCLCSGDHSNISVKIRTENLHVCVCACARVCVCVCVCDEDFLFQRRGFLPKCLCGEKHAVSEAREGCICLAFDKSLNLWCPGGSLVA